MIPWKLWNGYGPRHDGKMLVERIGPEGQGMFAGLTGAEGKDIMGTESDLMLAASAPALLAVCKSLLAARYTGGHCVWCGNYPDDDNDILGRNIKHAAECPAVQAAILIAQARP